MAVSQASGRASVSYTHLDVYKRQPFILKLAKKKDLTINLRHLMDFGKKKFPVDVKVLNTGDVVHSMEELMPIAFQFV